MASEQIKSRRDFDAVLGATNKEIVARLGLRPADQALQNIARQLAAVVGWTADGRVPTEEERAQIDLGLVALRELAPMATEADEDLLSCLYELDFYLTYWPDSPNKAASFPPSL